MAKNKLDTNDFLEVYVEIEEDDEFENKIIRICDQVNQNRGQNFYKKKSSCSSISVTFEDDSEINSIPKNEVFDMLDKAINANEELNVNDEDKEILTQEMIFSQITATLESLEDSPIKCSSTQENSFLKSNRKRPMLRTFSQDSYLLKRSNIGTLTQIVANKDYATKINANDIDEQNSSIAFLNSQEQRYSQQIKNDKCSQTEVLTHFCEAAKDITTQTEVQEVPTTDLSVKITTENQTCTFPDDLFSESIIGKNILIKYMEDVFDIGESKRSNSTQREDEIMLSQYVNTNIATNLESCSNGNGNGNEDVLNNSNVKLLLSTINDEFVLILKKSIENAKVLETIKQDNNVLLKNKRSQIILNKIYDIFNNLIGNSENNKNLTLAVRKYKIYKDCIFDSERSMLLPNNNKPLKIIKNIPTRVTFRLLVYLLRKIITLIKNNGYCTRREIYYQTIKIIKTQNTIDNAVIDICSTLDAAPWDIRIVASAKGLIYGNLRIIMKSQEIINCNVQGGILVPQNVNEIDKFETGAEFVLVVEKDSMFQKLLDEKIVDKLNQSFVMITGKGIPDINTRHLLNQLSRKLSVPIYILVDADPYGINIYFTYKFGSIRFCHLSEQLAVPNIRWLGILPNEISKLDMAVQVLTERDKKVLKHLLEMPYIAHFPNIENELRILQEKNVKAEMEGLMKTNTFFSDYYLPYKFKHSDFL